MAGNSRTTSSSSFKPCNYCVLRLTPRCKSGSTYGPDSVHPVQIIRDSKTPQCNLLPSPTLPYLASSPRKAAAYRSTSEIRLVSSTQVGSGRVGREGATGRKKNKQNLDLRIQVIRICGVRTDCREKNNDAQRVSAYVRKPLRSSSRL